MFCQCCEDVLKDKSVCLNKPGNYVYHVLFSLLHIPEYLQHGTDIIVCIKFESYNNE